MSLITSNVQDRILHVIFDDPASRNSFSVRAANELWSAIESSKNSIDGLIFTAKGRVFCSGGNLSDYASMSSADEGKTVNRRISEVLGNLSRLPIPTVCAISGDCFGGGIELVSAFDIALSVPHAVFGFWQRRIALSFGWGGGERIEARIGSKLLRRYALEATNVVATEALEHGLIDSIHPEPLLHEASQLKIHNLIDNPKASIGPMKNWDKNREQEIFESLWWNDEHKAALAKRK